MNTKSIKIVLKKIVAFIELTRPFNYLVPVAGGLSGAIVAMGSNPGAMKLLPVIGLCLMGYMAGQIMNDYIDRHVDEYNAPHRPIPSKRISPKEALTCAALIYGIFTIASFTINFFAGAITIIALILAASYSILKKYGVIANMIFPVIISLIAPYASLVTTGTIPPAVVLIAVTIFFYDFGMNIIGTFKDIEGDKAAGVCTLPVRIGPFMAAVIVAIASVISMMIAFMPYYLGYLKADYFILLGIALIFTLKSRISLLKNPTPSTGYKALKDSRIGLIVLYSSFIAGIIPLRSSIMLIAGLIGIVALLQNYVLEEQHNLDVTGR
jgi:4-hydroxybenzoate polyprenyltransferase/geranylgeranylglycerol-phosphate geranylgeranyltransferase